MAQIFVIQKGDFPSVETVSSSSDIGNKSIALTGMGVARKIAVDGGQESRGPASSSNSSSSDSIEITDNDNTGNREPISATNTDNSTSTVEIPSFGTNHENQINTEISLDDEKLFHENKAKLRHETFISIVLNEEMEFSWKRCLIYLFAITFIGFLSTLLISLVPSHDLVLHPENWYEILYHGMIIFTAIYLYYCVLAESVLNLTYIMLKRNIFLVILQGAVAMMIWLSCTYYSWTQILEYQYPVPFLGIIGAIPTMAFSLLIVWFRFPKDWRKDSRFQRRMLFLIFQVCCAITLIFIYQSTLEAIRNADFENQHFVSLALPIIRELSIWIETKLIEKCFNGDERRAKIFLQYAVSTNHAITLCYFIGSFATDKTSWLLMIVDFSINILTSLQIVWNKKFHPQDIQKQIHLLQELSVNELVEFHGPLSFILGISVAFYGPNAKIIGNVGNSYWAFTAIEDINRTLLITGIFFLIDFSSTLVSATILWLACKINLWKALFELQKEFSSSFCVVLSHLLIMNTKLKI